MRMTFLMYCPSKLPPVIWNMVTIPSWLSLELSADSLNLIRFLAAAIARSQTPQKLEMRSGDLEIGSRQRYFNLGFAPNVECTEDIDTGDEISGKKDRPKAAKGSRRMSRI